ncbi:MAG: cellulase family glycosylhydrolase [Lentisphaeria bacterium]|jgi:hypothetical protein
MKTEALHSTKSGKLVNVLRTLALAALALFPLAGLAAGQGRSLLPNGGSVTDKSKAKEGVAAENADALKTFQAVGLQALVAAVRGTGARNIVIAGGLGWSYDLSGILEGYAPREREGGNGIMYSHHNYPWKVGWQKAVLAAAAKHPIIVGEVGCPEKWEDFAFIKPTERYEKLGPGCTWPADMLGAIQKHQLNWTGFSFHPRCGPMMVIKDWDYTPRLPAGACSSRTPSRASRSS